MMPEPTVAVDFDGVIHAYTSGWKGVSNIPDPPVDGSIDALFRLLDAGFKVAIFSSRSGSLRGAALRRIWKLTNARLGRPIGNVQVDTFWVGRIWLTLRLTSAVSPFDPASRVHLCHSGQRSGRRENGKPN